MEVTVYLARRFVEGMEFWVVQMLLYRKVFPLGKGVSFLDYINAIRKRGFPNYVITIDKIPSTESYQAQLFFVAPYWWQRGFANVFSDGVLLNKCTIHYFKDAEFFTLQASPKASNLFYASSYIMSSVIILIFAIFILVTNGDMSLNNMWGVAAIIIIMLAPPTSIYFRDKKLLDKVGSLGRELEKN